jgi:alpha-amylase
MALTGQLKGSAVVPGKSWWDNLAEKTHEMRSTGFTAVWIPPVLKGAAGGFPTGFDPFDDYDRGRTECITCNR